MTWYELVLNQQNFYIEDLIQLPQIHFQLDQFLKLINPIVQEYMKEKSIDIIIDKKNIFMAKSKNDITNDILTIVNNKIK